MAKVWRKPSVLDKRVFLYLGAVGLLAIQVFLVAYAYGQIGSEYARSWTMTMPMFAWTLSIVVTVVLSRLILPDVWDATGRKKIIASLLPLGERYHVFYDLVLVHRGELITIPFLVLGPTGVWVIYSDNRPYAFVHDPTTGDLVSSSRWSRVATSNVLLKGRNAPVKIRQLLEDLDEPDISVQSLVVTPNAKMFFGDSKKCQMGNVRIVGNKLNDVLSVIRASESEISDHRSNELIRKLRNYAVSRHIG